MDPVQSILSSRGLFQSQVDAIFAYIAVILVIVGLCILFTGLTRGLTRLSKDKTAENLKSSPWMISRVLFKGPYSRVLALSSILYGVFYGVASGTLVFQPLLNFSAIYHVSTPSMSVATCCGVIGEYPVITVYASEHFGLVLIPLNLFFLFSISWLVGLNVALLIFSVSLRGRKIISGWIGGLGAFAGLFTACPTCAGLAMLSILPGIGGIGGLSTLLLLDPLRTVFVVASYPTLIISSIVMAKTLRRTSNAACVTRNE